MSTHGRGPNKLTRLPFAPLFEASGFATYRELGRCVGVSRSVVQAATARGLSIETADRWAIRLDLHPLNVWGDQYYQAEREGEGDGFIEEANAGADPSLARTGSGDLGGQDALASV